MFSVELNLSVAWHDEPLFSIDSLKIVSPCFAKIVSPNTIGVIQRQQVQKCCWASERLTINKKLLVKANRLPVILTYCERESVRPTLDDVAATIQVVILPVSLITEVTMSTRDQYSVHRPSPHRDRHVRHPSEPITCVITAKNSRLDVSSIDLDFPWCTRI